jgi:Helix-turn-helix domain
MAKQLAADPGKVPPNAVTTPPRRRFYFIKEAAAELRISVTSAYLLLARGQLRGKKVGGRLVILADELERFIAECPDAKISMPSLAGGRANAPRAVQST